MKLKKILPYIEKHINCRIFLVCGDDEDMDNTPVFEGFVDNIPWTLLNYKLIEAEDNEDSEAICAFLIKEKVSPNVGIRITLDGRELIE